MERDDFQLSDVGKMQDEYGYAKFMRLGDHDPLGCRNVLLAASYCSGKRRPLVQLFWPGNKVSKVGV